MYSTTRKSRWRRTVITALTLVAAVFLGASNARALDFFGGCGAAGNPSFYWDGNFNDLNERTLNLKCNSSHSMTVNFNAKVTAADVAAGGFVWELTCAGNTILKTTVVDADVAALPVGTEVVGECTFKIKCTAPMECLVEGVFIHEIELSTIVPAKKVASEQFPGCTTGQSGAGRLALKDDAGAGGGTTEGCNKMNVTCSADAKQSTMTTKHVPSGGTTTTTIVCVEPVFTPSTLVAIGTRGEALANVVFVSPHQIDVTIHVTPFTRPQTLPVRIYNTTDAVEVDDFTIDPEHWADHTLGQAELTVTDLGRIGPMDPQQTIGAGFTYPKGWDNQLYVGGLWLARPDGAALNRDYDADPNPDWQTGPYPGDSLEFIEQTEARERLQGAFTDGAGGFPATVRVEQESRADSGAHHVYLRYRIFNLQGFEQPGFYAGQFADFDVQPNPVLNYGGTDATRRLTWIGNGVDLFVGVVAIQTAQPVPLANATLILNPTYVWPNQTPLDFDRTEFLRGWDPGHRLPVSGGQNDYSALVSVGPLTLPAAGSVEVVFAVVGGSSLAELQAHADEAQQNYAGSTLAVEPEVAGPRNDLLALSVSPNPIAKDAMVSFRLATAGAVDLSVFDAAGRRVRRLAATTMAAGTHQMQWDGRDDSGHLLPRSMYFVRLVNTDGKKTTRVAYVR